jgi:predicted dehydrogenase
MASQPLGIGVIGIGAVALRGILPHLTQDDVQDRVRVQALCDPVTARLTSAAHQYGIPTTYASIEELLADPDLDAVTIASPIGLHFEHCRLALEAGKHVHINKTLCTTVSEANQLIELAAARNLRIVASPGEVLRPQLRRTRELIKQGAIGELSWVICGAAFATYHEDDEPERLNAPGGTAINPSWYFRNPGGGPLYDMTVYALHQLTSVLGPAKRVTAMSGIRIPVREFLGERITAEADDNTVLMLDFGDGVFAIAHGTAAGVISEQFGAGTYFGTRGTIDGVLLNGDRFEFPGHELTLDAPVTDWEAQMRVLPHVVGSHRQIPESQIFEDIMQLVCWVSEGKPTAATAEHARHVIDIIESGYQAASTGQTHELTTSFAFPTSSSSPSATEAPNASK